MARSSSQRTSASKVFGHLTEEERIDKACELLALGVLRLAAKRGLLKRRSEPSFESSEAFKAAA